VLLRKEGDAVIAIGQASHAWISGQLARAWGNARFAAADPYEEVCLAAEQHDVGMAEWDLRPSLNPRTGLPYSFLEIPLQTHLALWTAAPAKLLTQSRYAALLVSMHGTALQERRDLAKLRPPERELVAAFLATQRNRESRLAAQLAADTWQLARNQRLVWTWDSLSLAVCLRWPTLDLHDVPDGRGNVEMTLTSFTAERCALEPWPFASERVDVHCEGRWLDSTFESEDHLHRALDAAPLVGLTFTLARGGGSSSGVRRVRTQAVAGDRTVAKERSPAADGPTDEAIVDSEDRAARGGWPPVAPS
jgi:hypothetical protein